MPEAPQRRPSSKQAPATDSSEAPIPPSSTGTSAAEGVTADAQGNIYGAEVGPKRVMKYIKK